MNERDIMAVLSCLERRSSAVQLWTLEHPRARLIRSEEKARHVDFHRNDHQVALVYNHGAAQRAGQAVFSSEVGNDVHISTSAN